MKVLIGTDGSEGSFAAVKFVGRMLSPDADEVSLYYSPPDVWLHTHAKLQADVRDRLRRLLTEAVVEEARRRLPKEIQPKAQTIAGSQKAAHGLIVVASAMGADLIVLGARGVSPAPQFGLESVGRHVAHSANTPVLIVRGGAEKADALRVLLACDGSECSRMAGQLLHKFTWPKCSVGRVMTVVESLVAGHIPPWLAEQLRENEAESIGVGLVNRSEENLGRAREELGTYFGELPAIFQGHNPIVTEGHAPSAILRTIEFEEIDLVVVGARRLGAVGRLLVGSTSEHLLAHAPCSVLVVREQEKP